MSSLTTPYTPSGQIGPALWMAPLGGLISATLLSFIYAYISVYSPIAGYISIFFVLGFVFGTTSATGSFAKLGKCRNITFLKLTGFLVGLWSLYASWVVFLYAYLNRFSDTDLNLVSMFLSPGVVWHMIEVLNVTGWYSIKGTTPTGLALWFFWGIEALFVLGCNALMSDIPIRDKVFCENCDRWADKVAGVNLKMPDSEATLTRLGEGDLEQLQNLTPVSEDQHPRIQAELQQCEKCGDQSTCKLVSVTAEVNSKGRLRAVSKDLTSVLMLSSNQFNKIVALRDQSGAQTPTA